jgi:transposase-like protein
MLSSHMISPILRVPNRYNLKARIMDSEHFNCPNPGCPDFGKTDAGNVVLYTRYGRKQVRLLICKTCGKTFSELKGTLFWDSRLDWDKIEKIYRTLLEGQGIRATARQHGLSKNTVKRYLRIAKDDFGTIEHFLTDRGVIHGNVTDFRDLVNRHAQRGNGSGNTPTHI